MSHLSRIKTCINNKEILEKTLNDLGFTYEYKSTIIDNTNDSFDLIVQENQINVFEFLWDGQEYSLVSDLQFWSLKISYQSLLEKITQQYSYNSIITESIKQGFNHVKQEVLTDGSIKLMIQRWN